MEGICNFPILLAKTVSQTALKTRSQKCTFLLPALNSSLFVQLFSFCEKNSKSEKLKKIKFCVFFARKIIFKTAQKYIFCEFWTAREGGAKINFTFVHFCEKWKTENFLIFLRKNKNYFQKYFLTRKFFSHFLENALFGN